MTKKRGADFDLDAALEDPGFTPRAKDVPELLDRVESGADTAEAAGRALLKLGAIGARAAIERAARSSEVARARFTDLVSRTIAASAPETIDPELIAFASSRLTDDDARVRRYAASALGKLRGAPTEDGSVARALGDALAREEDASVRRALLSALGKVGGATAIDALAAAVDESATRDKARLMAERTLARAEDAAFDPDILVARRTRVIVRCRSGLESILASELDADLAPVVPRDAWGPGRVEVALTGAPKRLFEARTMLTFGFALPIEPTNEGDLGDAIVRAMTSDEAVALLRHHTRGALRYRIAWASGGKRRSVVWKAAAAIASARPELVNDPTASPWEAVVHEGKGAIAIELVPRVVDPRFAYRLGDVPAASHPTIAAALVRVARRLDDDVVWDPFVGSGTELCERAIAGPYLRLIGSDRDEGALEVARANLEAAHVDRVELVCGDALGFAPEAPTLIITNPPMGRRVLRGDDLGALLERFVAHAARALAPGGRLVWISPLPARTARAAERAGLSATMRQEIDMGGFFAELQAFSKH